MTDRNDEVEACLFYLDIWWITSNRCLILNQFDNKDCRRCSRSGVILERCHGESRRDCTETSSRGARGDVDYGIATIKEFVSA